jgi:hypothetical protein
VLLGYLRNNLLAICIDQNISVIRKRRSYLKKREGENVSF